MLLHPYVVRLLRPDIHGYKIDNAIRLNWSSQDWLEAYQFSLILHSSLPFLTTLRHSSEWENVPRVVQETFEATLTRERMALCLLKEELKISTQLLVGQGIPVIVLKGMDVAHRFYPDKMLRPMTDVDLLVPEAHFEKAIQVLSDGAYRVIGKHRKGRHRIEMSRFEDGLAVELHSRLLTSDKKLDIERYWEQSELFDIPELQNSVRVLSCQDLLSYLIRHASIQHRLESPVWLNDIYYILTAVKKGTQRLDWKIFVEQIQQKSASAAAWFTLSLLPSSLVPFEFLELLRQSQGPARRRFLQSHTNWDRWFLRQPISKFEIFRTRYFLRDNSFQFIKYLLRR